MPLLLLKFKFYLKNIERDVPVTDFFFFTLPIRIRTAEVKRSFSRSFEAFSSVLGLDLVKALS